LGVRNTVLPAIGVKSLAAFDAAAGFEAPRGIIEPAMNDLAVA
jgi:hypothetical protein